MKLFPNNNDCDLSFSIFTDYLLGQANTTLDYKCIQPVSDSLPVTLLDFDGNTVIQLYNMRSGNDQKEYRVHKIRVKQVGLTYSNLEPLVFSILMLSKTMLMLSTDYPVVIFT